MPRPADAWALTIQTVAGSSPPAVGSDRRVNRVNQLHVDGRAATSLATPPCDDLRDRPSMLAASDSRKLRRPLHRPQRTRTHIPGSRQAAKTHDRHHTVNSPHEAHSNSVLRIVVPSFLTRNPSGNLSTRRVPSDLVIGRSSSDTSAAPFAPHAGHLSSIVQWSRVAIR